MRGDGMVAAQVKNGQVVNIIVLPNSYAGDTWDGLPLVREPGNVSPGDLYDPATGVFSRRPQPVPPALDVQRRDTLRAKLHAGTATPAEMSEALAMLL